MEKNTSHSHHPHHLSWFFLRPETLKLLLHHGPAEGFFGVDDMVWFAKDAKKMSNPGFFFFFFGGSIGLDPPEKWQKSKSASAETPKWKEPERDLFSHASKFSGAEIAVSFQAKSLSNLRNMGGGSRLQDGFFWFFSCFVFKSGFYWIIRLLQSKEKKGFLIFIWLANETSKTSEKLKLWTFQELSNYPLPKITAL